MQAVLGFLTFAPEGVSEVEMCQLLVAQVPTVTSSAAGGDTRPIDEADLCSRWILLLEDLGDLVCYHGTSPRLKWRQRQVQDRMETLLQTSKASTV